MSKILKVRKVGDSLILTIPKTFAEVISIKVVSKVELELSKKDSMILKVLK